MTESELKNLIDTVDIKKVAFDEYEFHLEFVNGLSVRVSKETDGDMAVWDFESNVEKENRRVAQEKRWAAAD
jgi:hypothetical protein